ncbi:MAG TPA: YMGG-like glycine zipper-containing protein, partial [Gemmatimonadaceae bacterium]|nr:YMGG-like glycine zipper-containing protein [Gemmatimonadaceae bacterium]
KMFKKLLILPAAVLAFACSKGDNKQTAADSALNSDLSTAAATRPYTPLDSITAAERAGTAPAALRSNTAAPQTVYRAPVRRTTTTRRSSSGGTYSSAPVYSAPAPAPVVVKHTKRDAAIGAGAGAVIGAVAGHSVKGAIIGGAAGAILGGVIGNNVDKTKK